MSDPSASPWRRRLSRAADELRARGFAVRIGASGTRPLSARERAAEFAELLVDPEVAVVMSMVGGNGARAVLEHLDLTLLARNPKAVVGYSDFTALTLPATLEARIVTFYGPAALPQLGEYGGCDPFTWASLTAALGAPGVACTLGPSDEAIVDRLEWDREDDRPRPRRRSLGRHTLRPGVAEGVLLTANLSTLAEMLRDGWRPALPEPYVLLLEESDTTSAERFAEHVRVLAEAGWLDRAAGVGLGRLSQVERGAWPAQVVADVMLSAVSDGPVVVGLEIGHVDPVLTIPTGARGRLAASERVTLEVLEAPVHPQSAAA